MKLIFLTLFGILFFYSPAFSQGLENDTISVNDQINHSIQLYNQFTGAESDIYNGREYIFYTFKKEGTPFFEVDSFATGWVSYGGKIYQPMHVQYDIVRDEVVVLNSDNISRIILQDEQIDSFHFLNHTFIRLEQNDKQNLNNTGFYDLLYNGHTRVLAARKKIITKAIYGNDLVRSFYSLDRYYVFKDDIYYLVANKRDVLNLFDDKRHEIKSVMRKQKIKFRQKNFDAALTAAAKIYDQH